MCSTGISFLDSKEEPMRTRSRSSGPLEIKVDPSAEHNTKTGGKRFTLKLPKLRRNSKSQTNVTDILNTSGTTEPHKNVISFQQNLECLRLHEASDQLINREEALFVHQRQNTESPNVLVDRREEEKLTEDRTLLLRLVEDTLANSLDQEKVDKRALKSALDAIQQEEHQDQQWKERVWTPPAWRPICWRQLHDSTLQKVVQERMERAWTALVQASLNERCCAIGRLLKDDLLWVTAEVKSCYPAEMDICNLYSRIYHQDFSSRLKKIADTELPEKDAAYLLRWENEFYPGIFKQKELAAQINHKALGKLLPEDLTKPLEKQFLNSEQVKAKKNLKKIWQDTVEAWTEGVEPDEVDGCFVSPLAIDVIQMIDGSVRCTGTIAGDQRKASLIVCLLEDFLQNLKEFQDEVMSSNKATSRTTVMSLLDCAEQFRGYIVQKTILFPEDVKERCLSAVATMKQSGFSYLLSPVHISLKPQYRTLGTPEWLKRQLLHTLMHILEEQIKALKGLTDPCHQELMDQLQVDVTVEYVRRLLKGKVKLKDKERQEQAAKTVTSNAQELSHVFKQAGARQDLVSDILSKIAEVLRLQDLASIQLEIVLLGTAYHDLSEKHVSALLKLKTTLSQADRKKVRNALLDSKAESSTEVGQTFFSNVLLK